MRVMLENVRNDVQQNAEPAREVCKCQPKNCENARAFSEENMKNAES